MSTMYLTEYSRSAMTAEGLPIMAGQEPALAHQAITFTGTAGVSAFFNSKTTFVRIELDADGFILFGASPTAVTLTHTKMKADRPEHFGAISDIKVSAVV